MNYTRFPEQINKDTGLREFRLQRQDCINTPYEHLESRCSKNENVVVTPNEDKKGESVVVKELTPWLTKEKAKTIVEPTLQFDERNQKVIVNSTLRVNDNPGADFTEIKYVFEGSLKDFRDRFKKDKTERYVYLEKKSGGSEVVNALLYCVERPKCHEVAVLFSYNNLNEKGDTFWDSRTFQIDARESKIVKSDSLPGQAKPRVLNVEIEEVKIPEIVTDESDPDSSGLFESVLSPILPYDKRNHLCKGVKKDQDCPKYLFDPTLPNPNKHPAQMPDLDDLDSTEAEDHVGDDLTNEVRLTESPINGESKIIDSSGSLHSPEEGISTIIGSTQIDDSKQSESVIIGNGTTVSESDIVLPEGKDAPKPMPRPNIEEMKRIQEEAAAAKAAVQTPVKTGANYIQSIDGKFSYDLSKCSDKLNKIRNAQFHQAKGFYSEGRLEKASLFQTIFKTNRPNSAHKNKQYASGITNLTLEFAACILEQRYNRVKIDIHDFSSRNGGKLGSHGSHQNGLDVDVSYPHINDKTKGFDVFTNNRDDERTVLAYDYAKILYATDRVHIIFTDTQIKNKFCSYLKKHNKLKDNRNFVDKKLRHISGHRNHYHIRLKCTSQNEYCKPQGTIITSPCEA